MRADPDLKKLFGKLRQKIERVQQLRRRFDAQIKRNEAVFKKEEAWQRKHYLPLRGVSLVAEGGGSDG